jgi:ketosteroid isomerase-like protein
MRPVRAIVLAVTFMLAAGPVLAEEPAEVAKRFLQLFEKKDFATIRGLFAPGAVVSTVDLSRTDPPKTAQKAAGEWIDQISKELEPVTFNKIEVLETSTLSFDQGATVAIHFRSSGKAGEHTFTNEGIDTYSLTKVDGAWRIVRYGTFERLEFQ